MSDRRDVDPLFRNPFGQGPQKAVINEHHSRSSPGWNRSTDAAAAATAATSGGSNKFAKGIIAGGVTGGIEICITYPTEYIKTQLQLDEKVRKYNGIFDCAKQTVRERGFGGLYRGLPVLLYGSIPKSAVRFGSFEAFKKRMVDDKGCLTPGTRLLCGLGAGVSEAILVVTPMETVKVKFIDDQRSAKPRFKGFVHGLSTIVKEQGIAGTYKGLTATIMKQGSNQAIRFFVMESMKDWYRNKYYGGDRQKPINKMIVGAMGGFAGACSVFGNTPLDVIKTRMQGLEASKYKNTFDCARSIMVNEGPRAFYKGTIPRMSRVCLDVGITFMIYDSFMEWFNKVWP